MVQLRCGLGFPGGRASERRVDGAPANDRGASQNEADDSPPALGYESENENDDSDDQTDRPVRFTDVAFHGEPPFETDGTCMACNT